MKLTTILPIALALVFTSWTVVEKFGLSWGLSPENHETVQGIHAGMGIGFLAWFGYVLWKGEDRTQE